MKLLKEAEVTQSQINDVFNHIYEFFSRYYDKGDFIPKRRYGGKSKYSIPYNGEEVALYWATKDMYYVKTGEFFKKYSFRTEKYLVNFVLTEAQVDVGNVKGERRYFILSSDNPVTIDDASSLVEIRFNYRVLSEEESSRLGKSDIQATLVNNVIEERLVSTETVVVPIQLRRPEDGKRHSPFEAIEQRNFLGLSFRKGIDAVVRGRRRKAGVRTRDDDDVRRLGSNRHLAYLDRAQNVHAHRI